MFIASRFLRCLFAGVIAGGLVGCTDQLGSISFSPLSQSNNQIEQLDTDDGYVKLILAATDVWDDAGASKPEIRTVGGREMYFRQRPKKTFEQAWVRLGLFWHSKAKKKIILTAVALGDPVKIQGAKIRAGLSTATAEKVKTFQYTPEKRAFDKNLSSAAFYITPHMLKKLTSEKNAHITLMTSLGQLRVNLSATPATTDAGLEQSAKYLFAEFAQRRRALTSKS